MHKKIAIVYFGLLRSVNHVYTTHYNYIYKVLNKAGFKFKVFVHSWKTQNNVQNVWDVKQDILQNYDDVRLLCPVKYKFDIQEDFLKTINLDDYFYKDVYEKNGMCDQGEWLPELVKNHLCALESQKRVLSLVNESSEKFDYVMFVRPDAKFNQPFPVKALSNLVSSNNKILISNFSHNDGINDRFAVTNYSHAKYYANRIDNIIDYRKNHGRITSEKYLKFTVSKHFIPVMINFTFFIIRPDGKTPSNVVFTKHGYKTSYIDTRNNKHENNKHENNKHSEILSMKRLINSSMRKIKI